MSHSKSPCHFGLKGQVYWEVLDSDGRIDAKGGHPNLILDKGLDLIATNAIASMFTYCCVGTGNSTPIVSQLGLDNEKARTNNYLTSGNGCGTTYVAEGVFEMKRTFDFPLGALNSSVQGPYSEVGFSPLAAAGNNLFSRSLFKDGGGVPVTINVLPSQQLRVTYSLYVHTSMHEWQHGVANIANIGDVEYYARMGWVYPVDTVNTVQSNVTGVGTTRGLSFVISNGLYRTSDGTYYGSQNLEPYLASDATRFPYYLFTLSSSTGYADHTVVPPVTGNMPSTSATFDSGRSVYGLPSIKKPYASGDFYIDLNQKFQLSEANQSSRWLLGTLNLSSGNNENIGARNRGPGMIFYFPTPIVKDNLHTLTLTTRYSWGRV